MKNIYNKINRNKYSLGDLVRAVNSVSRDPKEATAALVDLLSSGKVRIAQGGVFKRVQVAST